MTREEDSLPVGAAVTDDAVTRRPALVLALAIGFVGVVFLAWFNHWYETVIFDDSTSHEVAGHALAPFVFMMVFLLLLVVNPILHRLRPALKLRRRELVLIFAMWLVTGAVSYGDLVQPILVMAGTFKGADVTEPVLVRTGFQSYLPDALFLNRQSAGNFFYGLTAGIKHAPVAAAPWHLWVRPLSYWLPFMAVILLFSSSVVQLMHRQWSRHELLSYPIATVAGDLIGQSRDRAWPDIFHRRVFWLGFATTVFLFTLNGLHAWFSNVPEIRLGYWYQELVRQFPFLDKYCSNYGWSFFRLYLVPYMVALAVLLPTEISLTCWLGWILTILGTGVLYLATGDRFGLGNVQSVRYGMMVSLIAVVLFIGRREYGRIVKQAFCLRRSEDSVLNRAAWACRVFLLSFAALALLLMVAGLNWLMAILVTGFFAVVVIFMARITAEVGVPYLWDFHTSTQYMSLRMFGAAAFGPKGLVILACIGGMLDFTPQNTLAQNETTYRKLAEQEGPRFRHGRFNLLLAVTACLALGVAIFVHLWEDYSFGAKKERQAAVFFSKFIIAQFGPELETLQANSGSAELDKLGGLERLPHIQAKQGFWRFFLYGSILIGVCAFLRLRFAWWPFHPLPLVFFECFAMSMFYVSFMIGWFIKLCLTRIGGGRVYARSRPYFIGLILGQLAMGVVWAIVGVIYFLATGGATPRTAMFYLGK